MMLRWDAIFAIKREMEIEPKLNVTIPNLVDNAIMNGLFHKQLERMIAYILPEN